MLERESIENANMATVEFKTQLLESAVAAGTLTKTADGMYKTLAKGTVSYQSLWSRRHSPSKFQSRLPWSSTAPEDCR